MPLMHTMPSQVSELLRVPTPGAWVEAALEQMPVLLLDHANCEKKAASTALSLMFRYPQMEELSWCMSRLAREELRHFEQVQKIIARRAIPFQPLQPSRYAQGLRSRARSGEPGKLADLLVIGAYIEARSCERFSLLAPRLDPELSRFYSGLLAAEARHFRQYLALACQVEAAAIPDRLDYFGEIEADLCTSPDPQFRFHSGPPRGS